MGDETGTGYGIVRDQAFAKRIEIATENHPRAPSGHGRQKWLRDQFKVKFDEVISPEATRKWFAGEARPRPKMMAKIAEILDVDEAWLSLGLAAGQTRKEARLHNAIASGAANVAAGMMQIAGASVAFPPPGTDKGYDFLAILDGRSYQVQAKYVPVAKDVSVQFDLRNLDEDAILIVVSPRSATDPAVDLYRIDRKDLLEYGKRKSGVYELKFSHDGLVDDTVDSLRRITDIRKLATAA